jgi:hypothetical protein
MARGDLMKRLVILGCLFSVVAPAASHAATALYFTSSQISFVGAGMTRIFTSGESSIEGSRIFNEGVDTNDIKFRVRTLIAPGNFELWQLDLLGPNNTLATVGYYPNAQRYPFATAGHPGLDFSGDGRGNGTLTGFFQVLQADFTSAGNLSAYAADFTQYDSGNVRAWETGSIRFNSDIPITFVPEPTTATLLLLGMLGCGWRRPR